MQKKDLISRRSTLKTASFIGASALVGSGTAFGQAEEIGGSDARRQIFKKVFETPLIDTHEHLIEEHSRGRSRPDAPDDWSLLMTGYLSSDLVTAGMPKEAHNKFFSPQTDPIEKWKYVAPYWPAVKKTGYGQAVMIAMRELYGVDELSAKTVAKVQEGYERTRQKGFYKKILCDMGGIESCQVNSLEGVPFRESRTPTLLMQDISIVGMFDGPDFKQFQRPTGLKAESLDDWYKVIDWWFDKYGKYAVAVKSQNAYERDINYDEVPADQAEPLFKKKLETGALNGEETKKLEDHLFWYAVQRATENNLPVKLHTGYYAGQNYMPLDRLINNAGSATALCRKARDTRFVFMHICYPYYEEILSAAKHYTNAYIDMCWAAIINPVAAKDFLKKYLVTAPVNKIVTFGGDYLVVEPVLGHAIIARRCTALALSELVEEGWYTIDEAMETADKIMHENAREIFNLKEKEKTLSNVSWS